MSRGIARLGDKTIGKCTCHIPTLEDVKGEIVSASPDTFANNFGVARAGDLILAECGHYAKIITYSDVTFANGLGVARLGDKGGDDCYECEIITASEDTFTY
jgi:uncharacterized Zn-binding protein involved in type VI secretion